MNKKDLWFLDVLSEKYDKLEEELKMKIFETKDSS